MEAKESLEEKVEEGVCGECGTILDDGEDVVRLIRVEPAGTGENGTERVSVTFGATRRSIDIYRGLIEATGGWLDMQHFIDTALREQTNQQVDHMKKMDKTRGLLERLGKGVVTEMDGVVFTMEAAEAE